MLTCTATDTFGRTVGGTTGKFAGAAAGTLLFGPAGAIVIGLLGATGGAMAGRRLVARSRELLVAREEEAVRKAARCVAEAGAESMPEKLHAWSKKSELLAQSLSGPKANQQKMQSAMMRRIREHISHWNRKRLELEIIANNNTNNARSLCERIFTMLRHAAVHAHHIQNAMDELGRRLQEYQRESRRFRTASS